MPTAILLLYTPGRLVMGADGRKMDRSNPSKGTDSAQKIFGIGNGTNHIAFALAGVAEYTDEQGEILFDFNKEIIAASREHIGKKYKNLYGYATRLSRIISKQIDKAKERGGISDLEGSPSSLTLEGKDIVMIFLAGFFNDTPEVIAIRLWHRNQILRTPEVSRLLVNVGTRLLTGAPQIFNLVLNTDDPLFSAYRTYRTYRGRIPSVLQQAAICENYVRACSDPEAIKIEPLCMSIGGHVHVATITPREGFQWVKGFEPMASITL